MLVNLVGPDTTPSSNYVVAVDAVGAGEGEVVIVVRGSSARQVDDLSEMSRPTPASWPLSIPSNTAGRPYSIKIVRH